MASIKKNVWDLGEEIADNPSLKTRISHSSKGTAFRRAFTSKGAFVSKLTGAGINVGSFVVKLLPIPIVAELSSSAIPKLYKFGKKKMNRRSKNHVASKWEAPSIETNVKFGWKSMSVADMDKNRWKIYHAVEDLNKTISKYQGRWFDSGSLCSPLVDVATHHAYVLKRTGKMKEDLVKLIDLSLQTNDWLNGIEDDMKKAKEELKYMVVSRAEFFTNPDFHGNCNPSTCMISEERTARLKIGAYIREHKDTKLVKVATAGAGGLKTMINFFMEDPNVYVKDPLKEALKP